MKTPWYHHDDPRRGPRGYFRAGSAGKVWAFLRPVICFVLIAVSPHAFAQGNNEGEYRLKLAFLYNFAQFVQWPPEAFHDPAAPLTLCVAGQDPFQGEIEQSLSGRTVGGHPIEIKRLRPNDDPRACHMIFVRASEKRVAGKLLAALKGRTS